MRAEQKLTLLRMAERAVRVNGEPVDVAQVEKVFLRYCSLIGSQPGSEEESEEFTAWTQRLEVHPRARTQAKDLYAAFVGFCRELGQQPATMHAWGRWMRARGYPIVSPINKVNYGVRLAGGEG
ncbi:hypothetical protein [Desulfocurvibacter africanus]|uniref:hypothetical protein n=1 Tax=Desulfocurvibacter africanus TaxID=873 RepID=UPI0003FABFB7|nr:hypothetical protein [Desulfocurvibacter africanus]